MGKLGLTRCRTGNSLLVCTSHKGHVIGAGSLTSKAAMPASCRQVIARRETAAVRSKVLCYLLN